MTDEQITIGLSTVIADLSIIITELQKKNGKINTEHLNLIDEINKLSVII